MRGSRVGTGGSGHPPPPLKYQKNIGFLAILDRIPCNSQNFQSHQASIQCWAITGPPAKRHLSSSARQVLVVFGSSLPLKKRCQMCRVGPLLTKLSGSAHVRYPFSQFGKTSQSHFFIQSPHRLHGDNLPLHLISPSFYYGNKESVFFTK